jgi:patatin-related protein
MAESAGTATATATPERSGWELSGASREIRLGLVVYGGVSLAIYINGVANELFRAHRGRGVYKLLKRLLDSHIVVDIISGTSAGGINGLLLAYALTNEREFGECASLWREHGSLSRLLRLIDDDVTTPSLLDSKNYYVPHLESAFRTMSRIADEEKSKERASKCPELDLFITGTSFDGEMSTAVDATGRRIDIKTHRAVFHLKHRAGRKTEFDVPADAGQRDERHEARIAALARLAAITSCFPAAFEPVRVTPHVSGHEKLVYDELQKWGRLNGETETWFLDGGVLDNKPFSYTIQEIFNRTAERPVDRKLFYVEPDPERFSTRREVRVASPNVVQAATQALFGIPGYESIADDLEQIVKQNDRLARLGQARRRAELALQALKGVGAAGIPPSVLSIYGQARLAQLSNRAVQGLMEGQGFKQVLNEKRAPMSASARTAHDARRKTASALAQAFAGWDGDGDGTLERYDVYVRRRRILHLVYKVFGQVSDLCEHPSDWSDWKASQAASLREVWKKLNEQLSAYEIVQWALEKTLDEQPMPASVASADGAAATAVWRPLERQFDIVLAMDEAMDAACQAEIFSAEARINLYHTLNARTRSGGPSGNDPALRDQERPPNLLQRLEKQTAGIVAAAALEHPELDIAWQDFLWHDAHFFPIDYFGDLAEKDEVDVVRVSPIDAERAFSERRFEDKITGETVMHFGAFLKKSWRSNDIMWGRLDGVCRILDALFTEETLTRALENERVRELLRADLEGELAPVKLFPNAGPTIQGRLKSWLSDLANDTEATRKAALADETQRDLLLWCAQFEILNEELPTVLGDAATEELEWNNVRTSGGFVKTNVRSDRGLVYIKGTDYTKTFLADLQKNAVEFSNITKAPVADYFLNKYKVGGETPADDIPPAVLAETITAVALVARNCLVNAFPKQGAALQSSLPFKLLVDWPLRVAHTFAVFARRERTVYLAGLTALFTYALLALVGGVLVLNVDLQSGNSTLRMIGLVVLPLLILVVGGYAAWMWAMRHFGRSWLARGTTMLLTLVTLLTVTPVIVAFVIAWRTLNAQLKEWMIRLPHQDLVRQWVPAGLLDWLVAHVTINEGWLTVYPLATLAVLFILVVPMLRGFVQSRMARRAARVSVIESARELAGSAYASIRGR